MLDGGPSRIPQPVDRRGAYRQEPVKRQPDNLSQEATGVQPLAKPSQPKAQRRQPSARRLWPWLVGGIIVVGLAIGGMIWWQNLPSKIDQAIDNSKYQAVVLADGQVYFGKLTSQDGDYFKLDDVFYAQLATSDETVAEDGAEPTAGSTSKLIKRGSEVHGPADPMIITKSQVLFFENLKPEGSVSQKIQEYKASNNR